MKHPKAIFFDMDGVLYDSMPMHESSWVGTFAAEGIVFPQRDAYLNEGRTGRGTINLVFQREKNRNATDDEVERIYSRKTELMRHMPEAPMMPRMKELIDFLRSKGIRTMVVTGSKQPALMQKLSRDYDFKPEDIGSGSDVKFGKPDPEPYLMALRRSGMSADECAVVENAPLGIRSAKAAGLFTIAVNTGKLTNDDLTQEKCDCIYPSTSEMVNNWTNLFDIFALN